MQYQFLILTLEWVSKLKKSIKDVIDQIANGFKLKEFGK